MVTSIVEGFLGCHEHLLAPFGLRDASQISSVIVTPRFQTSRNVVFLIFSRESPDPLLVAKVARVDDAGGFLAREAANLEAIHSGGDAQLRSVPRLVAYDVFQHEVLLIESAVIGQLIRPSMVRRDFFSCLDVALTWIINFHRQTAERTRWDKGAWDQLVDRPLDQLQERMGGDQRTRRLVTRTRWEAQALAGLDLPLVFEHGDLASPNLLLLPDQGIGVVDWELAAPRSLPAVDVFFFLTFMAIAREGLADDELDESLTTFRNAFFGVSAWTRPHVLRYANALGVPYAALKPLFLLCWARYVDNLLLRTIYSGVQATGADMATVLQRERYWALWEYAVDHIDELDYES